MSEKSPASKLVSAARRADELLKIAGGGSGGLVAALPDVLEELQNTLHELVIAEERLRLRNKELSATVGVLEAKQARYQRLFDFAPEGYLVTAPDGMIEEVNLAAASLFGAPKDHLVGKPLVSYVSEADRREFLAHLKRIPELGRGDGWELRLQPSKGGPFPVALTVNAVRQHRDHSVVLQWSIRDITERKRVEYTLRLKTDQLAAVTEAMTAFVNSGDRREASAGILRCALIQTSSEYGFVGVVTDGPVLRILAHEGIKWDDRVGRKLYQEALRTYEQRGYLEFTNFENLFGKVITGRSAVISNDPATDPRSSGLPPGHPPLRHFLGVPILGGTEVVGMIGVANRPGGYTEDEQQSIEILCRAAGVLYDSYRRQLREAVLRREREQAEEALRLAKRELEHRVAHRTAKLATINDALKKDIVDREHQKEALRKYELIVCGGRDYMCFVDTSYVYQAANDAYLHALGKTSDQIIGHTLADVLGAELFKTTLKPKLDRCLAGSHVDFQARWDFLGVGCEFVDVHCTPYTTPDGTISGVVMCARDITEQRRTEDEVRRHEAELAHFARLSTMGEMAAGFAHELNQPLSAIMNFSEACRRRLLSDDDAAAEVSHSLARITSMAERAGQIISRLRDLARKREPHRSTVDINDLVREAASLVASEARLGSVEVRLELSNQLPPLSADRIQIQQVILNLLRNGMEATVGDETGPRLVVVRTLRCEAGPVDVTIADTGPGLAPEVADRIFEAFVTTKPQGLGMGLSISRSIISAHGGRLWVETNPGRGVTFRFTLPVGGGTETIAVDANPDFPNAV